MKIAVLLLSALLTTLQHCSHCQSIVFAKTNMPKAGVENYYVYRPDKSLQIPDSINVVAVYINKQNIQVKTVSVIKVGDNYTFPFNIPDSTSQLIVSITKPKPLNKFDFSVEAANILDNNNGLGFIIPLYSRQGKRFDFEEIDKATLFYQFAPHLLKLNDIPKASLLNWYEAAYHKYPELKNTNSFDYHYYFDLLYKEKGALVKPRLLEYAKYMQSIKQDENKWIWAARTYSILNMQNERSKVEEDIVKAYPAGSKAKGIFWQKFYSSEDLNTSNILTTMNGYSSQFHDTSSISKDKFYLQIIYLYLNKKKWDSLPLFESQVTNKIDLSYLYNNFALRLYNEQLDISGNNLNDAKMLSIKAMNCTRYQTSTPADDGNFSSYLQSSYNRFADTYARILFKLGQNDSAFYYQDGIYKQADELDAGGIERYSLYSEKVKGTDYAKQLIEEQLLAGVSTPAMLKQLQSIYIKLGIGDTEFNAISQKSTILTLKKTTQEIKTKFGTIKARNFTLKNILGQSVSLSSLKGKVVVIDFWATWCTPCIAAFPTLQKTVSEYKNDKGVAFLFIDIWERTTAEKMQENATNLMKTNNYSFNVLLDVKDELFNNFKIESIPTQFIIDNKGNMIFMGNATDNITSLIEAAKTL